MYVIVFNRLGLWIVFEAILLGVLAGVPASRFLDDEDTVTQIQGGVAISFLLVADLGYRAMRNRHRGWIRFVHPTMGGQFFFIPVWVYAPVMTAVGFAAKAYGVH
jgi:hypothetical protein